MRLIAVIAALTLLAGCAGSPVGDAIAGTQKLAQADDSYCRSMGIEVGTPGYENCRLTLTQSREDRHEREVARARAAVAAAATRLRELEGN